MPARRVTRTGTPVGEQRGDSLSAMATTLYLFNTETRQWERVDTLQFTPGDNFLASKTPTLGPWLNFDKPEMRACLVVRVQTPSGQPRAQTHVIALGVDYNGFNSGMTGDDGRAELMVLRNAIARVNAGSATTPPIPTPGAAIPCGNAGTLTFGGGVRHDPPEPRRKRETGGASAPPVSLLCVSTVKRQSAESRLRYELGSGGLFFCDARQM
jgi:hypothetical protein